MKIVQPTAKVWGECPTNIDEAIVWIERAGRVCYRSEDKIIEGSGRKFVDGIVRRKHFSVIEHSNFVVRTKPLTSPRKEMEKLRNKYATPFLRFLLKGDRVYIGGNFRAWMEMLKLNTIDELFDYSSNDGLKLITNHTDIPKRLKMVTAEFLTDRAVTHELVRHRPSSYCLTGDTLIHHFANEKNTNSTGKKRTIKQLYEYSQDQRKGRLKLISLTGMDNDGELIPVPIKSIIKSGVKKVYKLVTANGRKIKASRKHRFCTKNGWKRLHELTVGDSILCNGIEVSREYIKQRYLIDNLQRKDLAKEIGMSDVWLGKKIALWGLQKPKSQYPGRKAGHGNPGMHSEEEKKAISKRMSGENNHRWNGGVWKNGNTQCVNKYDISNEYCVCGIKAEERHHIDKNPNNNEPDNIEFVCIKCHKARHFDKVKIVFEDEIISIKYAGKEETYDIEIDHPCHNFIANGLVVHNSQESQRYCAYRKHLEVIMPWHYDGNNQSACFQMWKQGIEYSEKAYKYLLQNGEKAEQARSVLPNSTATRIVTTATVKEWEHIFMLRTSAAAYPGIRNIINPVKLDFQENNWI